MAFAIDDSRAPRASASTKSKPLEYRLIFAVAFLVFFGAALIETLLPHNLVARLTGHGQCKSVIQKAKDSANTCAAYAFMG
ncbi:MAG: hypothetical protein ABL893_02585 [Hyphomicrobium sp.]|nr:hypothetical protein [Hyphomicrobium sp.]